jgi:hypothetical protein
MFYRVVAVPDAFPEPQGLYRYTGYDGQGQRLIVGWLTLARTNADQVTGSWALGYAGPDRTNITRWDLGNQIGEGLLRGGQSRSTLDLDLNPGWADNNVFLHGVLTHSQYTGQWSWSGFMGVLTQGTFKAEKVP